jgi:8-amino-7-oxononanoate synthase
VNRVQALLAARDAAGLRRVLGPRPPVEDVLDLAGNDYLGLARDPRVTRAAADAALRWGAGSTGSRLVTGTTSLHTSLESSLARFCGAEAALVFSSGYLANVGVLTALGGPSVTIVSDAANHASIIDGCRLSGSPLVVVPHGDVDKVDAALSTVDTPDSLVVTDGVFSVDGDLAPVRELHETASRHGALLMVDEAHAFGVVGPGGAGAAAGLTGDVVRTVTLSKSLGAQGGAVLASQEVIDLLVNTARTFIFDTGLAPAAAGAALAALDVLRAEPERAAAVRSRARALGDIVRSLGVETVAPDAAVVPAYLGAAGRAVDAAASCLSAGVRVGCFRPPSVPPGRSCLRLTARADLSAADLDRATTALTAALS